MIFNALATLFSKVFFFCGYYANGNAYPKPLSPTEESDCIDKMLKGDQDAKEKLIRHNMRLVAHIAKKYAQKQNLEDTISVGSIGLIKGINSFSLNKGSTLATYLARCIENEILMMLRCNKRYKNTVYLSDKMDTDNEGNEFTLLDVLAVNEESVFLQAEQSILAKRLDKVMKGCLTDREYQILILRYGLNGNTPHTQLTTATKFDISRSYVSRIETKALKKLRKVLQKQDF